MYGMIHRAIRDLVIEQAGPAAWDELERQLGMGPADMISAMVYPDEQTARILSAMAERLGESIPDALHRFGRHWVLFAGRGSYSGIMDFVSQDLAGFIANLDRMHQAVRVAMPEAVVPQFTLLEQDGARLLVRYRSSRTGLEPFVVGLLEGLVDRFGRAGTVTQVGSGSEGAEFVIELEESPAS